MDALDERQEMLYEIILKVSDPSIRDPAQKSENQKLLLQRQIKITDSLILGKGSDILFETLKLIVDRKKWHCKVLIRTILLLNKVDESNEKGYFEKTKQLIKKLLDSGICSK